MQFLNGILCLQILDDVTPSNVLSVCLSEASEASEDESALKRRQMSNSVVSSDLTRFDICFKFQSILGKVKLDRILSYF